MLSENLKRFRLEKKLTQEELAIKSGVYMRTISLIELGKTSTPLISTLQKIADVLDVNVNDLIK